MALLCAEIPSDVLQLSRALRSGLLNLTVYKQALVSFWAQKSVWQSDPLLNGELVGIVKPAVLLHVTVALGLLAQAC